MKFSKINEESTVSAGEYLWHEPTRQMVLCGSYKKEIGKIRALSMGEGGMMEDDVSNFKKVSLSQKEIKHRQVSRCKGCKG